MTTEDASATAEERGVAMTTLPGRGSVLVRSVGPPDAPAERYVDVRAGPCATFDGDRFRFPLVVRAGGERRRFDRSELPDVEEAVAAVLDEGETGADGATSGREPDGPAVVRFGDRAACRRLLPAAASLAIERRLAAAADRGSAVLLSWTTTAPRPADYGTYDAVLDPGAAGPE